MLTKLVALFSNDETIAESNAEYLFEPGSREHRFEDEIEDEDEDE